MRDKQDEIGMTVIREQILFKDQNGKYSKGNGNLHMAFKQESDIPKFAILNLTPSACESALQ